ncbi:MAG: bifunctional DNA primase/polymerase [Stackebrandtia sp.]
MATNNSLSDDDLWEAALTAMRANDPDTAWPLLHEIDARQDAQKARLARVEALAEAALWYVSQGLPVFPLRPKAKTPMLRTAHPNDARLRAQCQGGCGKLGHGFHDATTAPDVIAAWWMRQPRANIGLPTGTAFDVIDVDGPPGYASLAELEAAGKLPPRLAQVQTPGDPGADPPRPPGIHYYIAATGDGCATGIAPGLDYRGAGGYVAVPPSHGPSGGLYSWAVPLDVSAVAP